MTKLCRTCDGRGRWRESVSSTIAVLPDDYIYEDDFEIVWHECNDCKGTGIDLDPETSNDYDIGGDSYVDED